MMKLENIKEKILESGDGLAIAAITFVGAVILLFFGMSKTYPPSAFLAAFSVMVGAVLLIPLILRLAREEGR